MWSNAIWLLVALLSLFTVEGRSLRKKRLIRKLQWSDCGKDINRPVTLYNISVLPMPMPMPGKIQLGFRGSSSRDIGNAELELDITRKGWLDIKVPCISNIGSCTYTDSCTLLERMDKENWAGSARNIANQVKAIMRAAGIVDPNRSMCNFKAGSVTVPAVHVDLPEVPSIISFVAAGDYDITVQFREMESKAEIACINMKISISKGTQCREWYCG